MASSVTQDPGAKKEAPIVGIDFGTTYSGVAWVSLLIRDYPITLIFVVNKPIAD